jgi:tetratricopeptide (TPR) repeat protein
MELEIRLNHLCGGYAMNRNDKVIIAIREKSIDSIRNLFFTDDFENVNSDFTTETDLWDYKEYSLTISSPSIEWAELSKDVLSFYNTGHGGILFWGVKDSITYDVVGIPPIKLDSKIVNDKLRSYIGDKIWVEFFLVANNSREKFVGVILIPPSGGRVIQRFMRNGPEKHRRCLFLEDGTAIRRNDSSYVLTPKEANKYCLDTNTTVFSEYEVNEPGFRLLSRDYNEFLPRKEYCEKVIKGLNYSRAAVVSLTGIGGVGKTALGTWAVREAYKNSKYSYIISMTAKDRELTKTGIQSLRQSLTTLDDLLNAIAEVIGFTELKNYNTEEKEGLVRNLIENENVLLFVDNLETTSDKGIIDFLNDLPDGVKAIVTSRRSVIKVSSFPIEIGPFTTSETIQYIKSLSLIPKYSYCSGLSKIEMENVGDACNKIPLAIKWMISRYKSVGELLAQIGIMANSGLNTGELLEFSFRHIFEEMNPIERGVMQVLSLIDNPPLEAIIHALKDDEGKILDTLDALSQDTIIYSVFDSELRAYRYSVLPLTRNYVLSNCLTASEERLIKIRLTEWYEAKDIKDEHERIVTREMRQGNKNIGNTLIEFARNAQRRGDNETCKKILESAMIRDPQNWCVYREFAEYYRHSEEKSEKKAIELYKLALKYAQEERMSSQIAIAHREFGILYSNSGEINSTDIAIKHLTIALSEMPHDGISAKFLSSMYLRKGAIEKAIEILQPFQSNTDWKTLNNLLPILSSAYSMNKTKYMLELTNINDKMDKMGIEH